jgi:diaminopropionate ammonia-lyase
MLIRNPHPSHNKPLAPEDMATLNAEAAGTVERFLEHRPNYRPTPLLELRALARRIGVKSISVKDEGLRLGLGSFKALGGSYAVIRLVLEEAVRQLGRPAGMEDLNTPDVRSVAAGMTFACATDGNHGRSVAQGAQYAGAKAVIFVHSGVSSGRVAAIANYGAEVVRVSGSYDDSVEEASSVSARRGWIVVSDTSWPGYERIPGLVMQGYTAIVREAMRQMPELPTHFFIQAGVGGAAAALAGHFSIVLGASRPKAVVVEPERAACVLKAALAGHPVRIAREEPTVMAMLECYEASLVAWRVLSRAADAFMTVAEDDAVDAMKLLACPDSGDPPIVAGESGGVGLAGLLCVASAGDARGLVELNASSRVLIVNTEGATDPQRYAKLTGLDPETVGKAA